MKAEHKVSLIQEMETAKLFDVITLLAKNLGYINVRKGEDDNIILCEIPTAFNLQRYAFIITIQKQSSREIEDLTDLINTVVDKHQANFVILVSSTFLTKGLKEKLKKNIGQNLNFIEREDLIKIIDQHNPNLWKYSDPFLLTYDEHYCSKVMEDTELKRLRIFNDKYHKLLDLFIEPNIINVFEKPNTNVLVRERISVEKIVTDKKSFYLSGGTGAGKTTLLRQIGKAFLNENENSEEKYIPIFIQLEDIVKNDYKIGSCIDNVCEAHFASNFDKIAQKYRIVLLIDSIDEIDEENQKSILNKLNHIKEENNVIFILSSRNSEKFTSLTKNSKTSTYHIQKFNIDQIRKFISLFFKDKVGLSENLLEALTENRTLEKLPITPLTLSLISILYEENNLEIPATVTDIYNNFNHLMLGKSTVSSRIEFIDISFKERMLSLYALELLNRKEHLPFTYQELKEYFRQYFKDKTIPIRGGDIDDAVTFLVNNTGILSIKSGNLIQFSHDSFMEYYASLEIFKHQRNKQHLLVENFYDPHWQNTAVFYAGGSRDMPEFLTEIKSKLSAANKHNELLMGVIGAGYILQALYQTDNNLRKQTILEALNINIKHHELLVKLSADEQVLMKNFKLPVISAITISYFFECFHSITLKHPLQELAVDLVQKYESKGDMTTGFMALQVAIILASRKLNNIEPLERLIFGNQLYKDPMLLVIADFVIGSLQGGSSPIYDKIKKELKKDIKKLDGAAHLLTTRTTSKLRFSTFNEIYSPKKVTIITEGKTDAEIVEHAFITLTNGELPYWRIKPIDEKDGGANSLTKMLQSVNALIEPDEILIGIFDRDEKGYNEFRGLKGFDIAFNSDVKVSQKGSIYAICLPVPEHRNNYAHKENKYNFMEIEHYFDDAFLKSFDVLKETVVPGIYEIYDGKKTIFSSKVRKNSDSAIFRHFTVLFETIDKICQTSVSYVH